MRLICLVDNCVSRGSTLWGEHGLSFLIETPSGRVLWDAGLSGTVWRHNMHELGLEGIPLSAIALSHAHYDHTGGLEAVLELYPQVPIYAHAELFRPRFSRRQDKLHQIGLAAQEEALRARADLRLSDAPQELAPGVWTSGGIHNRPYPQGSSPHHFVKKGDELLPDDYADDMSLILEVPGGVVLLCGCCHAGLRNTLALVRERYQAPLRAIIGGTHLLRAPMEEIQALAEMLRREGPPKLFLNHCTGEKAIWALAQTFGTDIVAPCPAGTILEF